MFRLLFGIFLASALTAQVSDDESVIADFEGDDYGKWVATGSAFGSGPAQGTFVEQRAVSSYMGKGLVNSFLGGDDSTGSLISPEFTIERPYICFLIGGGNYPGEACINLLVNDQVVRTATGKDNELLLWANWDVSKLKGQTTRVQIVDDRTGGWGHINIDQIVQSDEKKGARLSSDAKGVPMSTGAEVTYAEPYRPQFHFSPERNWCNDANGLVYYNGEYHLFYQYNPSGNEWGHMSWGHAVSTDLVRWQHLPVALPEDDGVMIFSGSTVVDWRNTSGFGNAGTPPLVAIYTGHRPSPELQTQCLAYSLDRGRTWTKYEKNPVLDIGSNSFRDPKVFWHESSKKWIMVVSHADEHKLSINGSEDLKMWKELSTFGPVGYAGGKWECPDLFQLPVEGQPSLKKWVLHVGVGSGAAAGGSGGQYFVGEFDGKTFRNDNPGTVVLWSDYGKDDYAAVSWSDIPASDGRRLWMGWLNDWEYANKIPTQPWKGAMTIPRALGLRKFGDKIRLIQRPVTEMRKLRTEHVELNSAVISSDAPLTPKISGDAVEIMAEFLLDKATEFGLKVRKGGEEQTIVGYDVPAKRLFVDRSNSGERNFSDDFPGTHGGPLSVAGGRVKMHIFVDRSSVEVFGNDGETVITDQIFPKSESQGVEVYAKGGSVKLTTLEIWKLDSIWRK